MKVKMFSIVSCIILSCSMNQQKMPLDYQTMIRSQKIIIKPCPEKRNIKHTYKNGKQIAVLTFDHKKLELIGDELYINGLYYGELDNYSKVLYENNKVFVNDCLVFGKTRVNDAAQKKYKDRSVFTLGNYLITAEPGSERIEISEEDEMEGRTYSAFVGPYYIVIRSSELYLDKKFYGKVTPDKAIEIKDGVVIIGKEIKTPEK